MNKIESNIMSFVFWGNEVLNSFCDGFSNRIVVPLLQSGYHLGGEATARVAECFSTRMGKNVQRFSTDCVSPKETTIN